jgi:hypothetical protein
MISLDFETHYDKDISLTNLSPEAYIKALMDLGKVPYLVSIVSPTATFVDSLGKVPWTSFYGDSAIVCCHNSRFDKAVFKACAEKGLVPKEWLTKKWICTADLAVYNSAPRNLQGAAKYLLGVEVSKDLRKSMKGVDWSSLSPEKQEEMRQYCLQDAKLCYQLAEKYLPTWPESEQVISQLNREIGMYGVQLDEGYISHSIQKLHQIKFDAEKKLPWRDDPEADTVVLSTKAVAKLCGESGIPMPSRLDDEGKQKDTLAQGEPEVVAWEAEYGKKYPWVAAMRDYRKANILLKKLQTMQRHSVNGILYFSLKYFGAHTGRFSGGGGFNPQNLPGRKESFVSLRHAIVARPSKELCVIDWCQIEPRILRWAVKDQEALDLLARGISIYEAYAIQHFGWVSKGVMLKKENPALYGLAKAAVLGAGYGCGPKKYKMVAKNMADIDLSEEEAAHQVNMFRQQNPKVVALWNSFAFKAKMSASRHHDFAVTLPSGRKLHYFKPSLMNGLTATTSLDAKKVSFLHGGLLTENYIQAVARDVFTLGLVQLADAGYQNLFHVHDEYVLEVAAETNHTRFEYQLRNILLAPIPWLPNCPLDVEFKWRLRYGG